MKTADFLRQHNASRGVAAWALSVSPDMSAVWEAMIEQGKHERLIWAATRPGVFPDSVLRKLACQFVRKTPLSDGRKVWNVLEDGRSRKAIEVAEAYADGKATEKELADAYYAADVAAWAAAYSAFAADVDAAARAAAYYANVAAAAAARASANAAAYAAADAAADVAAWASADAAAWASAHVAAHAAQARMIAELGNPFKEESESCLI